MPSARIAVMIAEAPSAHRGVPSGAWAQGRHDRVLAGHGRSDRLGVHHIGDHRIESWMVDLRQPRRVAHDGRDAVTSSERLARDVSSSAAGGAEDGEAHACLKG
ncbi:hypothetical protein GCM10029963_03210 [Micromonospora andamanensis]